MQYYFIGAPGSGKTTIALHLASRFKIPHINYRVLVIEYLKKETKEARRLKKLWLEFKPFSPKVAFDMLHGHLRLLKNKNYVLDGYPKTEEEANY